MNAAMQRRLTPVLGAVAAVLAALSVALGAGVGQRVHWDDPAPPEPLPPLRAAAMPAAAPLAQFAEVWQRPLFMADRKPAPVSDGDDTGGNLGDLELTGIIMTPALKIALLRDQAKNATVRVKEGAALTDTHWTLTSLTARSAVFENGGDRRELTLKVAAPDPLAKPNERGAPPNVPGAGRAPGTSVQPAVGGGMRVSPAQASGMTGPALPHPVAGDDRAQPARQDDEALQRARIEALKQAVQRRRIEQQQQRQQAQDSR